MSFVVVFFHLVVLSLEIFPALLPSSTASQELHECIEGPFLRQIVSGSFPATEATKSLNPPRACVCVHTFPCLPRGKELLPSPRAMSGPTLAEITNNHVVRLKDGGFRPVQARRRTTSADDEHCEYGPYVRVSQRCLPISRPLSMALRPLDIVGLFLC